jgi:PhnB protein
VQVALISEAGSSGGRGYRLAGFEQAAGSSDAVGQLQGVGWEADAIPEKPNEPELADAGGSGELVEADVSLRPVGEVVARQAERPVVAGAQRRSRPAGRGEALDHRAEPRSESFVALQPGRRRVERTVHLQERTHELGVANDRFGKEDPRRDLRILVAREVGEIGDLDDDQTCRPRLGIDRRAGVAVRRVPGDELARYDEVAVVSTARKHRLPSDDSEDVFTTRLDGVARRVARHQQDAVLIRSSPYPHLLGRHLARLAWRKNVQDDLASRLYGPWVVITPHIVVRGAERAVSFYRDAFGAEEVSRIPTPDGRLMSVELRIGDGRLHLADEFPELGVLAPPSIGGTAVVLALDVEDAEAAFTQAVAAGAQVRQPLQEAFWGELHGQVDDPFGHRWNVGQHLRDVPHEEVVAAAARAFT